MQKEQLLRDTQVFLLDLDGTVYLDETPIGEVKNTLKTLRAMGKKLVFLTNNSSKTQTEYQQKLNGIGLLQPQDLVYTSAMATISHLNRYFVGKSVYLLATDAVKDEFIKGGVSLTEEHPDLCVLAYDTTLTFEKLKKFNEFLAGGASYIATHPDNVCPTKTVPMPDVGALIELFSVASARRPDLIIGKPYSAMAESLCALLNVKREELCMIGDRMYTDIRFACNNQMKSVLVLSGETTEKTMKDFPDTPDLVLPTINELV